MTDRAISRVKNTPMGYNNRRARCRRRFGYVSLNALNTFGDLLLDVRATVNDNAQVIEDVAGRRGGGSGGGDVPADVLRGGRRRVGGARMRFTFTQREM